MSVPIWAVIGLLSVTPVWAQKRTTPAGHMSIKTESPKTSRTPDNETTAPETATENAGPTRPTSIVTSSETTHASSTGTVSVPPLIIRAAPKRLNQIAEVEVEWAEPTDNCPTDQLCVQGQLFNAGGKTAYGVTLIADIGGTAITKPRTSLKVPIEQTVMEPGDRQEFSVQMDRKMTYKEKGKDRIIEVGKYNYKLKPEWVETPPKKAPPKKSPPKKKKP